MGKARAELSQHGREHGMAHRDCGADREPPVAGMPNGLDGIDGALHPVEHIDSVGVELGASLSEANNFALSLK